MAAQLHRSDLQYHYSWKATTGDNPNISGSPDNDLLDRDQGYEVLNFINKLMVDWNLKQKASGLQIETLIKTKLPGRIRSHKNIKEWIAQNW